MGIELIKVLWKMMVFMEPRKARELAARLLKVGEGRVFIDPQNLAKVSEAMTKDDIRGLIAERIIKKKQAFEQSKGRARKLKAKRQKGRRRGKGKKLGTKKVRSEQRTRWINSVRVQRKTLKELKQKNPLAVEKANYSEVYKKIKGNYFRGKRHLVEYIEGVKK
jgi:large subunit ribosomal protein L19e